MIIEQFYYSPCIFSENFKKIDSGVVELSLIMLQPSFTKKIVIKTGPYSTREQTLDASRERNGRNKMAKAGDSRQINVMGILIRNQHPY